MMKVYFDSSALVKIYVSEAHSERARREARAVPQLPLTWLHTLEVSNALRVLTGRKLLTAEEARGLLEQFEDDRQAQRLADAALDWPKVFHESVQLSRRHAARLLCRSLDILHVAAAVELGCKRFVSADERQLALAEAIGLKAVDIRKVT
jgi:predicted nucleic acid-binding protein